MWKSGSTPNTTSSATGAGPGPTSIWAMLAQVRVAEHRGAAVTGRPTGEDQHGEVVGLDVDQGHRRRRGQVVELAGAGRHDLGGTDGGSLPIQLGGGARRVERHRDGAEAERARYAATKYQLLPTQRDPVAGPDARAARPPRMAADGRGARRR